MDEFKPVVKMKCGGSVNKAVEKCSGGRMKDGGKVMHEDTKEDKKLIKKAFSLHDDQKHEGKTDLSKLKKGGRCKREGGTVTKYKAGGNVKKMADGSLTAPLTAANQMVGSANTPMQNATAAELMKRKMAAAKARGMGPGMAPPAPAGGLANAPAAPMAQPPAMKRGGKACK